MELSTIHSFLLALVNVQQDQVAADTVIEVFDWHGNALQEGHGAGSTDGVIAISKGVIQRDHQHAATITGQNLFQPPNPFNLMPEDDVDSYKANLEKQSQSESGELSVHLTHVWFTTRHILLIGPDLQKKF